MRRPPLTELAVEVDGLCCSYGSFQAAQEDMSVTLGEGVDAPTSAPCGITISITLDC